MWYMLLTIGLLLAPAGGAALQIAEAFNLPTCIAENQTRMGAASAHAYCRRLRDEALARQQAPAAAIERAYQDCLILNQRTMGSVAENYCAQRRDEALTRQQIGTFPRP